jgi:hypothetical protein
VHKRSDTRVQSGGVELNTLRLKVMSGTSQFVLMPHV